MDMRNYYSVEDLTTTISITPVNEDHQIGSIHIFNWFK
jgi:hypothetical protein